MLQVAQVAVFSQKNTKHINTVWQSVQLLNVKLVGASRNQKALKGYGLMHYFIKHNIMSFDYDSNFVILTFFEWVYR